MLFESTLVRTTLRRVLTIDKRIILLAILPCVGKSDVYAFSLKMHNRIEPLRSHVVGEEIFQTVARDDATTIVENGKPRVEIGVVVDLRFDSSIFITEGNSASGSITQCRDVNTQAVFSLRGKPLNSYGLTKKVVYENEEFNLLQAALNIEDGLDGLRYNKVIIATDADVDGMHIRLLMMTFFLQFFPDLVKKGHVYILQTPLFRVRNKKKAEKAVAEEGKKTSGKGKSTAKNADSLDSSADSTSKSGKTSAGKRKTGRTEFETIYCYNEEERVAAIERLSPNPEITRFKGLGEISADEFKNFIGPDMRLEPVTLHKSDKVKELLAYYMGKNTMERQNFIIDNLVVEEDLVEEI